MPRVSVVTSTALENMLPGGLLGQLGLDVAHPAGLLTLFFYIYKVKIINMDNTYIKK